MARTIQFQKFVRFPAYPSTHALYVAKMPRISASQCQQLENLSGQVLYCMF